MVFKTIERNAYAKINLTLEVLGRREDGFHNIVSVLQTITLHDKLSFRLSDSITLDTDCRTLNMHNNLVIRAAEALRKFTGCKRGATITLKKRIPIGSGLGGGSSDASATLIGLNELWDLGLTLEDLSDIAASLGSDVPFFLRGGTAMVSGRGERVYPLPPASIDWIVVLKPSITIENKTSTLYELLTDNDFTNGRLTRKLAARIQQGGDVPSQLLFNVFEPAADRAFHDMKVYRDAFNSVGASEIRLAGSGPALFALVAYREAGSVMQSLLKHLHGRECYLTRSYQPE